MNYKNIKEQKQSFLDYLSGPRLHNDDLYLVTITPNFNTNKDEPLFKLANDVIRSIYHYMHPNNKRNWHRKKNIFPIMWGFVERRAKFKVHSKTPVSQYSNNVLLPHIHGILVVNKDISEQFNIGECLDDPWNNLSLASIPNLKSIDIQLITETPEKAIDYAVQIDWNGDNWDVIGFGNSDAAYVHKKTAA